MRNRDFLELFADALVTELLVERHNRRSRVERDLDEALLPRKLFGELESGPADPAALSVRRNGDLPHLDYAMRLRHQDKAANQLATIVARNMEIGPLVV